MLRIDYENGSALVAHALGGAERDDPAATQALCDLATLLLADAGESMSREDVDGALTRSLAHMLDLRERVRARYESR